MSREEFDAIMKTFHAKMKTMQPEPAISLRAKYGPPDCRVVTPEGRAIIEHMREAR